MNSNSNMLPADAESSVAAQSFQVYSDESFEEQVLSTFLEQSAKYMDVYCEQNGFKL